MNEQDRMREALRSLLTKGMKGMLEVGSQGAEQVGLRSLRKKKERLYMKLGKEAAILADQGDLMHPGLTRALSHLAEVEQEIEAYSNK
jgi:hypothetical protein